MGKNIETDGRENAALKKKKETGMQKRRGIKKKKDKDRVTLSVGGVCVQLCLCKGVIRAVLRHTQGPVSVFLFMFPSSYGCVLSSERMTDVLATVFRKNRKILEANKKSLTFMFGKWEENKKTIIVRGLRITRREIEKTIFLRRERN